ncbi:MAG: tRNA 5-hydroxyuridine modification protein YegQ [Gammaproteobacteria bacterium]|nr:tRNA 5-hydroxyuridine modification protein YegQ [Gammaproteobacteria bacterium]MDH3559666.1 tRNA 5-hydroxyuridine modification protein YegQ [Gammaproteobacteria bacterium]
MKTTELLAPAGTLNNLRYALAYGADAVYAGMPRYSLRVRNNDFHRLENLARGIRETHARGKAFYLASNILPHNVKVKTFLADMEPVIALDPDALIMADPGLILMVRERWPELPIHLSVQANTMNFASVRFWQQQGIARIVLSRELSLDQIEEIRQECPDMELEVFVHGALCVAYSGRCLLSGYFNHRDANQGTCTNSCRWDYKVRPAGEDISGDIHPLAAGTANSSSPVYLLEEAKRPGELMPIEEDEHGTYIMNSRDLRALEHVERLVRIGVESLKIEGRTKSYYYVARTTQVYRQAIDDAAAGRPFDARLLGSLENLSNRGYTDGFLQRHPDHEYQNYLESCSTSTRQRFVGELTGYDRENGMAHVTVKNKFAVGDEMELVLPCGNRTFRLADMRDMEGNRMQEAPGGGYRVQIPLDGPVPEMGLLARRL